MGLKQQLSRREAVLGALVAGACAAPRVAGIESRGTVAVEAFAGGFHNHRFVRAEGAGHYVQREQPDLVAKEIEALIARLH